MATNDERPTRHREKNNKQGTGKDPSILAEAKCFIRSLSEEESKDSEAESHDLKIEQNKPGVSSHTFTKRASGRS